jgi:hypothetical protein
VASAGGLMALALLLLHAKAEPSRPVEPLTPSPAAVLPHLQVRSWNQTWNCRDEAVATVSTTGPPWPVQFAHGGTVTRTEQVDMQSKRPEGPVTLRFSHVQVHLTDADDAVLPPLDEGLWDSLVSVTTTPRGGLEGVTWPAAWTRAGLALGDFDDDLSLLFPALPPAVATEGQSWQQSRQVHSTFLLVPYTWQVHETYHLTQLDAGLASIAWESSDTAQGLSGQRQGSGLLIFNEVNGRWQRIQATITTSLSYSDRQGRSMTWSERRQVEDEVDTAPEGAGSP